MRAVVQRVRSASVRVAETTVGEIAVGLLVFLGVGQGDDEPAAEYLAEKTLGLRIFADADGKMNLSVVEVGGSILVVSQFTLLGDCRKGRRPSFVAAAPPHLAEALYRHFAETLRRTVPVALGQFQADMQVALVNDGPVTLLLDSHKLF
jgi:D-tyrosyl-tRNA(Tyr) deacylase